MIINEIVMRSYGLDNFVALSMGSPAAATFPVEKLKKYYVEAMDTNANAILDYGVSAIATEEITKWLIERGFNMDDKGIMLIPGSGVGMDVMAMAFCDKDDVILTEQFTYPGLLQAARMAQAKVVPVKSDINGIDLADLEAKAKEYNPKFFYIVPTFSNPGGATQTNETRKGILELAEKYDFLVYEDDPYANLRFKGEAMTPMIAMPEENGRVIHAETFSKILSSGIRVGFLVFNLELYMPLMMAFGNMCDCSGPTEEMVGLFMRNEDIWAQCKVAAEYYAVRLQAAMDAMEEYLPEGCSWTKPEGGMFIWVECPDCVDTTKLAFDLIDEKRIGVVPSAGFSPDPEVTGHGFRLCVSTVEPEQLGPAMKDIAELIQRHIDEAK